MGNKWEFMPNNYDNLESLEVLINENNMKGLLVQYNGIHVDRLHEFFGLNEGAKYFTTKFFHDNTDENITFVNSHGEKVKSTNPDAVFFSLETEEQDELEEMIKYLAKCCLNQDLNINMTVHYKKEKFDIVSYRDDDEYVNIGESKRGISYNKLEELLCSIKQNEAPHHKK